MCRLNWNILYHHDPPFPPLLPLLLPLGENMSRQFSKVGEPKGVAGKKGVPDNEADPGVRSPAPL